MTRTHTRLESTGMAASRVAKTTGCHLIRLRHHQGSDQAWEALRRWVGQPGHSPARLIELASMFRGAELPLRDALEVLLPPG